MNIFQAILLGIVQGVAEFLPISSSGHLALMQNAFGLQEVPAFFDVLLHFGTLVSICIVFRKDLAELWFSFVGLFRKKEGQHTSIPARRLLLMLIIACLPLVAVVFFSDAVESMMGNSLLIGLALIGTGVVLFLSDRVAKGTKTEKDAKMTDALFVGVCQAIAIIPGLSRSGMTITGGLTRRFSRNFAVRFSFLLAIPAILGGTLVSLIKTLKPAADQVGSAVQSTNNLIDWPVYLIGAIVAGVVGYFAINLIRHLVNKGRFGGFAYYCIGLGIIAILAYLILGGTSGVETGALAGVTPT